jgi:small-conductance mechanosensitive channel
VKRDATRRGGRIDDATPRFDHARMPGFRIFDIMRAALFALAALLAHEVLAADEPAKFDFDAARAKIAEIRKQVAGNVDPAAVGDLRDTVVAFDATADAIVADRAPKLAALAAQLAELGPAPEKGAPAEAADIAAHRASLARERTNLDAEIKRAKMLAAEGQQVVATIDDARRAGFQARLSQRALSPLAPAFWRGIADAMEEDGARAAALGSGIASALADAFAPDNRIEAIVGIAIGLLLMIAGRWWIVRLLMRITADRVPHGRLRRSALAFAIVVATTLSVGFGARAIVSGLDWHGALSNAESMLARSIVNALFFGSFVAGLGRALLSPTRPSWRLPPIGDAIASSLRGFPLMLGGAVALGIVLRRANSIAGASLSATIATSVATAVLYAGIVLWALLRAVRARRAEARGAKQPAARSLTVQLALAAIAIAALVALVAVLTGFIAFGQFVAALLVRALVVGGAFYLVMHLVDDALSALASMRSRWTADRAGAGSRALDQLAVVLSGAFRVVAFLFALSLVFSGFGSGRAELSALSDQIGSRGLSIGQFEITPDAVLGAIAVFLIGLLAVHALKRWLHDRYLPTTSLDPAMRSSVTTLLGYAGAIVVVALALSALGISVERIAWVASALSVGIGFGLQAVVQNFVSGLILLVERPVKVGDWVAIGDVEGDIRRINVRATEIQMGDRSTMIVPNSELITKTIRNVTLANAQGRVLIRLPMPLDTDADVVLDAMRAAFAAARVLENPAPSVTIDGIENARLVFVGAAFIDNPRQAGAIRSEILRDLLARLRASGVALVVPQEFSLRPTPAQ